MYAEARWAVTASPDRSARPDPPGQEAA